jgi:hypothetical protein
LEPRVQKTSLIAVIPTRTYLIVIGNGSISYWLNVSNPTFCALCNYTTNIQQIFNKTKNASLKSLGLNLLNSLAETDGLWILLFFRRQNNRFFTGNLIYWFYGWHQSSGLTRRNHRWCMLSFNLQVISCGHL